jgi:GntR family transcriptional regulator
MVIRIEPGSQTALYAQLIDQIQLNILSGRLAPGDELPSLRKLAVDTGTSLITTRRAYDELEAGGWIISLGGRGTRVAQLRSGFIAEKRRFLVEEKLRPGIDLARGLGIGRPELNKIWKSLQEEA